MNVGHSGASEVAVVMIVYLGAFVFLRAEERSVGCLFSRDGRWALCLGLFCWSTGESSVSCAVLSSASDKLESKPEEKQLQQLEIGWSLCQAPLLGSLDRVEQKLQSTVRSSHMIGPRLKLPLASHVCLSPWLISSAKDVGSCWLT